MFKSKHEISMDKIAKEILNIPTLEVRNSDELDFHTISVWTLKEALTQAYIDGEMDYHDMITNNKNK